MPDDTPETLQQTTPAKPPAFRVMVINADGTVFSQSPLPVGTDEAALKLARQMVKGRAVELWDGLRFIERLDP